MLFSEALVKLGAGHSMHRKSWAFEDGYLKLMDGMQFVWKIVLLPNPNAGNYIFSVADFLSDDWELFAMPQEPVAVAAVVAETA